MATDIPMPIEFSGQNATRDHHACGKAPKSYTVDTLAIQFPFDDDDDDASSLHRRDASCHDLHSRAIPSVDTRVIRMTKYGTAVALPTVYSLDSTLLPFVRET